MRRILAPLALAAALGAGLAGCDATTREAGDDRPVVGDVQPTVVGVEPLTDHLERPEAVTLRAQHKAEAVDVLV